MRVSSTRSPGLREKQPPPVASALDRSLQLSLNGSYGWGKARHGAVSTYEIKRGARWQVEGVREVK